MTREENVKVLINNFHPMNKRNELVLIQELQKTKIELQQNMR